MCSRPELEEIKAILEHVDAPTRAEMVRRCAHYEREISHLKEQYRQLQEVKPLPKTSTVNDVINRARADINNAIRRAGQCTVFYNSVLKRFKIVTQEVRIATESRGSELVGIYTGSLDKTALTEDLYAALEGST